MKKVGSTALRFVLTMLLLLQPLAARGLADWLPCPEACGHCAGTATAAAPQGCGCEEPAEPDATASEDCRCVHAPDPAQPVESAKPARVAPGGESAAVPIERASAATVRVAPCRAGLLPRDGRPPPRLAQLCVWRE